MKIINGSRRDDEGVRSVCIAVDNDVQIAADKTAVEICASVQAATDPGQLDELDTYSTMETGGEGEENDGPHRHIH